MPKYNVRQYEGTYFEPDVLPAILAEHGVKCEQKSNGSIWTNYYEKNWDKLQDLRRFVDRICHEHDEITCEGHYKRVHGWRDPDSFFFGRLFTCTTEDHRILYVFFPRRCQENWSQIAKYVEEQGYRVHMYGPDSREGILTDFVIVEEKTS